MGTSIADNQYQSSPKNIRQRMLKNPLLFFFLIAYIVSWILSIPFILSEWEILPGTFTALFAVKSFGPFLAGYLMIRILEGRGKLRLWRKSFLQWRVKWLWYIFLLVGIPALIVVGIIVQPGSMLGFKGLSPSVFIQYPLMFIAVLLAGEPLGEEPGWRGFALPRLQYRYGALRGTLLLGLLWTGWHLPDFLTSAQGGGPGTGFSAFFINFPIFLLLIMSLTIILTWIFNHTKGSIFIALLAHASVNTPLAVIVPLFPALNMVSLNISALIGFGIPALLILLLTRGQLGYKLDSKVSH